MRGWDEFSEFLLENRVPTSADFNTYPIRIFYLVPKYFWSENDREVIFLSLLNFKSAPDTIFLLLLEMVNSLPTVRGSSL